MVGMRRRLRRLRNDGDPAKTLRDLSRFEWRERGWRERERERERERDGEREREREGER